MGDNEGERKGNLIEPEEKAVLRREFEARQYILSGLTHI